MAQVKKMKSNKMTTEGSKEGSFVLLLQSRESIHRQSLQETKNFKLILLRHLARVQGLSFGFQNFKIIPLDVYSRSLDQGFWASVSFIFFILNFGFFPKTRASQYPQTDDCTRTDRTIWC